MLVMLLISIPIYVCASEATPVAAALVMKGLNPGAALVFLLVGPGHQHRQHCHAGPIPRRPHRGDLSGLDRRRARCWPASHSTGSIGPGRSIRARPSVPRPRFIPEPVKVGDRAAADRAATREHASHAAAGGVDLAARSFRSAHRSARHQQARGAAATAAIARTLYLASGLFIVEPGEVGVRLRFGEIVSPPLEPGSALPAAVAVRGRIA